MPDAAHATTLYLYAGKVVSSGAHIDEFLDYLRTVVPYAHFAEAVRKAFKTKRALGELYISLYRAATSGQERFRSSLREAHDIAQRLATAGDGWDDLYVIDIDALDLARRIAIVGLDMGVLELLPAVKRHAKAMMQETADVEAAGEIATLLLGIELIGELHCADSYLGRARAHAMAFLRPSYPPSEKVVPEPIAAPAEMAGPTLVVVPSLDHLPGSTLREGARPHQTPLHEFGPLAEKALPVVEAPNLKAAADTLRAEFPWASDIIETMLTDSSAGMSRVRPTLFLGKPGGGKTRLSCRIGEVLGLPVTVYPAGGNADGSFAGTSRQWSSGRASVVLQGIRRAGIEGGIPGVASILCVIDEVDKVSSGSVNGDLHSAVIPFLEPESARRMQDPYLEAPVDLSGCSYIVTANDKGRLPGPLLDRLRILEVGRPGREHMPAIVRTMLADLRAERNLDARWLPDLDGDELDLIDSRWKGGSMRLLRRLVAVVVSGREALAARH